MDVISATPRGHLPQTVIDEIKSLEESTRALRSRRNALAPISRLPPEILATIFTLLSASAWDERSVRLEWLGVTHVCHRWREIALNYPRFWSYINFTKLSSAGKAEILARAKTAPLHLEVDADDKLRILTHFDPFEGGPLETTLARLSSSAPLLESISFSHISESEGPPATIPVNLLNGTAPNLTSLELEKCDISWKSPFLKGLRNLQIRDVSKNARPELEDWLDALNEMPKLETLSFQSATPLAPLAGPLISERARTITLPSLTHFHIDDFAKDCALALAHILLPTLTWLHVDVKSHDNEGEDVQLVIPYIAQNVYVLQDIEPIRSILIAGKRTCAEVCAWAMPDADLEADVEICDPASVDNMSCSACLMFSATGDKWRIGVDTAIFDALLTHISLNSVLTLTAHNSSRLSKEFWLKHASRLPLLEQACLVPVSVGAFRGMLAEDTPPDGPRLPSLTRLILLDVTLTAPRMYHLGDMLIKRVEEGVPVEFLDLSTCFGADRATQFFAEIVVDVLEPLNLPPKAMEEFSKHVGIGYRDELEVKYDDEGEDDSEDEVEDDDQDQFDYYDDEELYNELLLQAGLQ
jgi:hypothetical protein